MTVLKSAVSLKMIKKTRDIPIIFLTAVNDKEGEEKGLSLGAVDYIIKPFNIPVVKARVKTHLELKFYRERLEELVKERNTELIETNKHLLIEINERTQAEEAIKTSLKEKEALLQELHHRTYNNMQVICGMLNLQISCTEDENVKNVFKEMVNRILSMAKVHQKLYQAQNLSNINLREYICELSDLLMQSYNGSINKVTFNLDLEDVNVLVYIAIPCGLILNELISNAFKYAFPDNKKGQITIKLYRIDGDLLELQVSDNGIGVPKNFDFRTNSGMGLQIVFDIVEHQLDGSISFESSNGVNAKIRFKDKIYSERV